MRVLVAEAQVPFVHGGAEILVRQLVGALRAHGYEAEIVAIPYRDHPRDQLMAHAAAWRLIDLTMALNRPIDLVIATKFPTYLVRHAVQPVRAHRGGCGPARSPGADGHAGARRMSRAVQHRQDSLRPAREVQ